MPSAKSRYFTVRQREKIFFLPLSFPPSFVFLAVVVIVGGRTRDLIQPEYRQVADGFPETDQVIGGIDLYAFEPEYQSEAGDFLEPFACLAQGGIVSLG